MGGKWLELIQKVAPDTEQIGIIFNPNTVPYAYFLKSIESAAPLLALKLDSFTGSKRRRYRSQGGCFRTKIRKRITYSSGYV